MKRGPGGRAPRRKRRTASGIVGIARRVARGFCARSRRAERRCARLAAALAAEREISEGVSRAWERLDQAVRAGLSPERAAVEVFRQETGARTVSLMQAETRDPANVRIVQATGLTDSGLAGAHQDLARRAAEAIRRQGASAGDLFLVGRVSSDDAPRSGEPLTAIALRHAGALVGVVTMSAPAIPTATGAVRRRLERLAVAVAGWLHHAALLAAARELSMVDDLTGCFNRRYLSSVLERELDRARRAGTRVALAMLDLDHFKRFNDAHGHPAGDDLLRQLALVLRRNFRAVDVVCRYGGEEFAAVLPETARHGQDAPWSGAQAVERVRDLVARFPFVGLDRAGGERVTISAGVALFPRDGTAAEALVAAADAFLYQAKAQGRNCVVPSASAPPQDPTLREGPPARHVTED